MLHILQIDKKEHLQTFILLNNFVVFKVQSSKHQVLQLMPIYYNQYFKVHNSTTDAKCFIYTSHRHKRNTCKLSYISNKLPSFQGTMR